MTRAIPYLLVWFRLLLAPGFWIGYALGADQRVFAVMLVAGIISDIYDGILARRWGTSEPPLRRFDSNTDSIFYGCAGLVGVLLHVDFLRPWRTGLVIMFALLIAQNLVHGFRYRQQPSPSYHLWSGKLWSIALVIALVSLFLGTPFAWAIDAVVALGIFNCVEAMIVSLISSKPLTDINTLWHAIRVARMENQKQ